MTSLIAVQHAYSLNKMAFKRKMTEEQEKNTRIHDLLEDILTKDPKEDRATVNPEEESYH